MKRILLATPKGGSGKTMTARNLAAAAAQAGLRVATADLDPQRTLTHWSRARPEGVPAIEHFALGWDDVEDLLEGEDAETDLLVIDTPPSVEAEPERFGRLLKAVDLVLVPVRPSFDDATSAAQFLAHLQARGRPAIVVLNAVKPRVQINRVKSYLLKVAEIAPVEIADRTDHARAGERGMSLADLASHAGAAEIGALWDFVRGRVWGRHHVAA